MNNELTAEQYKVEVLKRNFASSLTDLYERLANLETELQMAKQTIERYEASPNEEEPVVAPEDVPPAV